MRRPSLTPVSGLLANACTTGTRQPVNAAGNFRRSPVSAQSARAKYYFKTTRTESCTLSAIEQPRQCGLSRIKGLTLLEASSCAVTQGRTSKIEGFAYCSLLRTLANQFHCRNWASQKQCCGEPYSWYKYARLINLTHPPAKKHKKLVGLKATRPNEYLHIDTTYYALSSEKKVYITAVMDNYS